MTDKTPTAMAHSFLQSLFSEMQAQNLRLEPHWDIDHLCYRVANQARYLEMKDFFSRQGDLLVESEVNGRLISTFELFEPVEYNNYQINLIELPAPKVGKITQEGFEHFEIVCDEPFENIIQQNSKLKFDVSGLAKTFNKELEVSLNFGAVKFHHLSLSSVIALEKNKRVWSALQKSKILHALKDYCPLVAGTFPLGIETASSDLDILICANNLQELRGGIEDSCGTYDNFKIESTTIDGLPTLIANFVCDEVPFEIFAQDRPAVEQKAYQHFLAEEKILKFGGSPLRSTIQALRTKGMKTEPAFAQALGLQGDAFEELLRLHHDPLPTLKEKMKWKNKASS